MIQRTGNLNIFAGRKALAEIREQGLRPERVQIIAGAAGGPKWLALNGLDRAIFSSWMNDPGQPVFLIGSSIGAWRFAAIAQDMGSGAYDLFEKAYLNQHYSSWPSSSEVTEGSMKVMDAYLDLPAVQAILSHRFFRLNIITVKCSRPLNRGSRLSLAPVMLFIWLMNFMSRKSLGLLFSRTLIHDPRSEPPFFNMDGFPIQKVALTGRNLKAGLLASGSIPLVMDGVKDLSGASPGMYRDGGIIDYHLDIPFGSEGIVLYPHYSDRIIPGWLDKMLPWRRPDPAHMENVVLVCPSRAFVSALPYGKIPDRDDFMRFRNHDEERIAYWKEVVVRGRVLGEEFLEMVATRRISDAVRPLEAGQSSGDRE